MLKFQSYLLKLCEYCHRPLPCDLVVGCAIETGTFELEVNGKVYMLKYAGSYLGTVTELSWLATPRLFCCLEQVLVVLNFALYLLLFPSLESSSL